MRLVEVCIAVHLMFNESVSKQEVPIVEVGLFIQIILDNLKSLILISF